MRPPASFSVLVNEALQVTQSSPTRLRKGYEEDVPLVDAEVEEGLMI
jgi:hypothetical protein